MQKKKKKKKKTGKKKRNANIKQRYLQPPLITKHIPPSLIQIIIPSIHLARKLAKSQRQTPPNAKLKIGLPPKYQANKQNQENFLISTHQPPEHRVGREEEGSD